MSSRSSAIVAVLLAAATSPCLAGGESACSRIEFRRDESLALAHQRGSLADAYGAEVAAIRDGEARDLLRDVLARLAGRRPGRSHRRGERLGGGRGVRTRSGRR